MLAASTGHLNIVKLLIAVGAHVNLTDRLNTTALHYASARSHANIARELIANGSSTNTNTPFSFSSPLKYLIADKHYSVAKSLVLAGCDMKSEGKWLREWYKNQETLSRAEADFRQWLKEYTSSPPRLLVLCRQSVRQSLGDRYLGIKVAKLPIPKYLADYLLIKF